MGRLISCNRHDICRSHLTFVPNLPDPYLKHQSVHDEKSNPGLVPVGDKLSVKPTNGLTYHSTARCHVSGANSQASSGLVTSSGRVVRKPDRLNL